MNSWSAALGAASRGGRWLTIVLFVGLILYIGVAVALAFYLLVQWYSSKVTEFDKAAIGALIAVIGTGLTALAALYSANCQNTTAREIERLRTEASAEFQRMSSNAAESLERLKVYLSAGKTSHTELCGAAATYFYALRSAARGVWDDQVLAKANATMVDATRHLIYVSENMRNAWLHFWTEAERIHRAALAATNQTLRSEALKLGMLEQVDRHDLRNLYQRVEDEARAAISAEKGDAAH